MENVQLPATFFQNYIYYYSKKQEYKQEFTNITPAAVGY